MAGQLTHYTPLVKQQRATENRTVVGHRKGQGLVGVGALVGGVQCWLAHVGCVYAYSWIQSATLLIVSKSGKATPSQLLTRQKFNQTTPHQILAWTVLYHTIKYPYHTKQNKLPHPRAPKMATTKPFAKWLYYAAAESPGIPRVLHTPRSIS